MINAGISRSTFPYSYTIYPNEATYVAQPDSTLSLAELGNTDFATLIANVQNLLAADGSIFIKAGIYPITRDITLTTKYLRITGEGTASVLHPNSNVNAIRVQADECEIDHLYIKHEIGDKGNCISIDPTRSRTYIHDNRCDNGDANIHSLDQQSDLTIEDNYTVGGGSHSAAIECINKQRISFKKN